MVFDPALVKELFEGSNEQLHAGEANAVLGPILGQRSVLLRDGVEHLRHRRMMLPPFHGRRMQSCEEVMIAATDREVASWPRSGPSTGVPTCNRSRTSSARSASSAPIRRTPTLGSRSAAGPGAAWARASR